MPNDAIGDHLEVVADADLIATHLFACTKPGYVGWRWAVNVTRVADSDVVTVNETVLLGTGPSLSPSGSHGTSELPPVTLESEMCCRPHLTTFGYFPDIPASIRRHRDDDLRPVLWELGLGRVRVLSVEGRGKPPNVGRMATTVPNSPIAKAATDQCSTCGFLVVMNSPLGRAFRTVREQFSPSMARFVTRSGAAPHGEAEPEPPPVSVVELVIDDLSPDTLDTAELTDDELEGLTKPHRFDRR